MSTINVLVTPVTILPHMNADRLELARIGGQAGFICVVGKNEYKTGDLAIYFPPDSVLSDQVLAVIHNEKLAVERRIRAIKIRGIVSEGLCLPPKVLLPPELIFKDSDVTEYLQIQKFQPSVSKGMIVRPGKGIDSNYKNPNFFEYTGIERIEKHSEELQRHEMVGITTKFHGMNFRAGFVDKPEPKSFIGRIWNIFLRWSFLYVFFGKEFLVGSHSTIRKERRHIWISKKFPFVHMRKIGTDQFVATAKKYHLHKIVPHIAIDLLKQHHLTEMPNIVLYAELIGPNVQKGYEYGVAPGNLEIKIFDISMNGKYLNWGEVEHICQQYKLPLVDSLFQGPFDYDLLNLCEGIDEYNGRKYVREGIVIKPLVERNDQRGNRIIYKKLNPAYLLDKRNTEFH